MTTRTGTRPENAVALVTGASGGIGRAIALRLAQDGLTVAVNYQSNDAGAKETVSLVESAGGRAVVAHGDVAEADGVDAMFGAAESEGPVSVVVNNAGIRRDGLVAMMKQDDWDAVLRTNLDGAFLVTKRAVRAMLSKRWGRIVNVASVAGVRGNPGQGNYSAAKAGLIGLTRTLAREVAARGITVNAVAPGIVLTAMTDTLPKEVLDAILAETPIKRMVSVDEVAAAVAFFASDSAAAITGQVLCVDGGMTA